MDTGNGALAMAEEEREAERMPVITCNLDLAIDTLAVLIRDFGTNAFDLPETSAALTAARCEQWAKHVLFAAPPPGDQAAREDLTGGKRDWTALRAFFQKQRRQESDYVTNALTDMRQVLWTCVRELSQSRLGEARTDDQMHYQMERLQEAAQSNDLETIKREALTAVTVVCRLMAEQRQQQQARMEALHTRIRELDSLLAEARREISLDALTNLFNRKAFNEQITHTLDLVSVFGETACLFLVDADHFKKVNDTYGHPAGDAALRALADCLTATFTSRNDCVARYGGEEFAVICQEMRPEDGQRLAERLLRTMRDLTIRHAGIDIRLTVSIGLAEARAGDSISAWIERADNALYRAKNNGRDRIEIGW